MTANHEHTPTTEQVRELYAVDEWGVSHDEYRAEFDRWLATVEAAAEQRGAVKALRDAAESHDVIDHMYKHFDNHPIQAPAAVRATATYLHNRADQMEADHAG